MDRAEQILRQWNPSVVLVESPTTLPEGADRGQVLVLAVTPSGQQSATRAVRAPVLGLQLGCAVPDLRRQSLADARQAATSCGLTLSVPANANGVVGSQVPAPGTLVALGSPVEISIASGAGTGTSGTSSGSRPATGTRAAPPAEPAVHATRPTSSVNAVPVALAVPSGAALLVGGVWLVLRARIRRRRVAGRPQLRPLPGPVQIRIVMAGPLPIPTPTVHLEPVPGRPAVTVTGGSAIGEEIRS